MKRKLARYFLCLFLKGVSYLDSDKKEYGLTAELVILSSYLAVWSGLCDTDNFVPGHFNATHKGNLSLDWKYLVPVTSTALGWNGIWGWDRAQEYIETKKTNFKFQVRFQVVVGSEVPSVCLVIKYNNLW